MRQTMLSGHERSLTQVKYNSPDGDLIFSVSKDHIINVWFSHNGERLGTFSGHNGTVWTIDADSSSTLLVSGSADNTCKLWHIPTGKLLHSWEFPTAIKRVAFSEDETKVVLVTERRMGFPGSIEVFKIDFTPDAKQAREPILKFSPEGSKSVCVAWSYLDKYIVSGHEDGAVALFDGKSGEQLLKKPAHEGLITDLQMSSDGTWFITSSKDKTAKLHDADSLSLIKTYQNDAPVNSAASIPGKPYVLIGGGQEAMSVTTTSARQGHFEIRLLHRIFEEEIAQIKGGFGPCNTISVHPKGTGYAIGGEDGYVRVHHFDPDFFTAKPYGNIDSQIEE